jgi:hypothetical protein
LADGFIDLLGSFKDAPGQPQSLHHRARSGSGTLGVLDGEGWRKHRFACADPASCRQFAVTDSCLIRSEKLAGCGFACSWRCVHQFVIGNNLPVLIDFENFA